MVRDRETREAFPWQERRGLSVFRYALDKGVLLRPLGNVIYFMPPYVINEEEIGQMVEAAWEGISAATVV
jgi:adenosylmethionine-8-amino-7-oxononanoate aminotransferase